MRKDECPPARPRTLRARCVANTAPNAGIQYSQFGSEFRHLAENLNILANVVTKAQASLRSHGVQGAGQIRWDPASLLDIVGDFRATLRECEQLLRDNERYGSAPDTPVRSIGWNVLVQPTVDRLRGRIQLHNARIQTVLKPFEMYADRFPLAPFPHRPVGLTGLVVTS